jgi:2-keto-4-pentenoate hydratase/2-oxohepta-3-ene-1,7-dioic acid hydratase in catechol pathway
MRFCRFINDGAIAFGHIADGQIHVREGELLGASYPTGQLLPLSGVELLTPVVPGKIIGIGKNYAAHARELGDDSQLQEPLIFLKATSAILPPGGIIERPAASQRVDYEGELGVVIGRKARNMETGENPLDYVFGYCCVNDVTARDLQVKDVQYTRSKSFDTFCPFGPWIETDLDPAAVSVETRVNGEIRQQGNTRDMIFPVAPLIRFLSGIMTLYPGDLIATGTPVGISPLAGGDVVEVTVEGIGTLRNGVQ